MIEAFQACTARAQERPQHRPPTSLDGRALPRFSRRCRRRAGGASGGCHASRPRPRVAGFWASAQ
eukprot:4254487-Alexandrium_andersonii.AAC.1